MRTREDFSLKTAFARNDKFSIDLKPQNLLEPEKSRSVTSIYEGVNDATANQRVDQQV